MGWVLTGNLTYVNTFDWMELFLPSDIPFLAETYSTNQFQLVDSHKDHIQSKEYIFMNNYRQF